MATFVKRIQTDDLHLKISIKSHLPIDVLAQSSFARSWASSNPDNNFLPDFIPRTQFPDRLVVAIHDMFPIIINRE